MTSFWLQAERKHRTCVALSKQSVPGCKGKCNVVCVLSAEVLDQDRQLGKMRMNSVEQFVICLLFTNIR